jgi:hypothetical protein
MMTTVCPMTLLPPLRHLHHEKNRIGMMCQRDSSGLYVHISIVSFSNGFVVFVGVGLMPVIKGPEVSGSLFIMSRLQDSRLKNLA